LAKRVKLIQQKLDRLDEAFLFQQSIRRQDLRTATRQAAWGADVRPDRPPRRRHRRNSTYRASWLSQNASCRAHQTSGCRLRSITSNDCSSCSFRKESRATEIGSIEPPQRHHFSTTWRRPRGLMKRTTGGRPPLSVPCFSLENRTCRPPRSPPASAGFHPLVCQLVCQESVGVRELLQFLPPVLGETVGNHAINGCRQRRGRRLHHDR